MARSLRLSRSPLERQATGRFPELATHIFPDYDRVVFAPGPRTTLILLLALAAVIFVGALSRQEETTRVDRDRDALRRFADGMQTELQRLEALYESHLTRLARTSSNTDVFETRRAADRFVGIPQISFIHPRKSKVADAHVQVSPVANERTPVPAFTPPRTGPVEITATLDAGTLAITVSDEGPGIPAREAERIFRPFERLDSRINKGATGTGLGLPIAIARDLAASMGGSLRLIPSARGASFELHVPAPSASPLSALDVA